MPAYFNVKVNQGDDVGGVVEAVGSEVRCPILYTLSTPTPSHIMPLFHKPY